MYWFVLLLMAFMGITVILLDFLITRKQQGLKLRCQLACTYNHRIHRQVALPSSTIARVRTNEIVSSDNRMRIKRNRHHGTIVIPPTRRTAKRLNTVQRNKAIAFIRRARNNIIKLWRRFKFILRGKGGVSDDEKSS